VDTLPWVAGVRRFLTRRITMDGSCTSSLRRIPTV
jgi:hypothetical protein